MAAAGVSRRIEMWMLLSILGLGLLLRVLACVFITSPLESDYLGYWTIAQNLYAGRGLVGADGQPTAFLNVGYPLFLWAVFDVLGPGIGAVKAANIALGVFSIALLYSVARKLLGGWRIASLAALFFALYLEAVAYTAYVAKENLMIFLFMLQFALVADAGRPRWRDVNAVLFGCATGGMALVGNAGLVLLPALLLQLGFATRRAALTWRYMAISAVLAMLTVTPLLLHNHKVFGAYVLNNNGGFNLYVGNNPNSSPYFMDITDTPIGPSWHQWRLDTGERGADVELRTLALDYIAQNPGRFIRNALDKAVAFWLPPTHAGRYQESAAERLIRLGWLIEFCGSCMLFLAAFLGWRRWGRPLFVLAGLVVSYTAIHMVFYVIYRYRLPIMPVVCMGAGLGAHLILAFFAPVPAAGSRAEGV